jgi:hypothetical protein
MRITMKVEQRVEQRAGLADVVAPGLAGLRERERRPRHGGIVEGEGRPHLRRAAPAVGQP